MKISKALGLGLFFHVLLIAVLVVQPSCTTLQPPTQTYQQSNSRDVLSSDPEGLLTQTGRNDLSLDTAFNSGLDTDAGSRFTPTRPGAEFSEFEGITPRLSPILSDPGLSTVEVAGPSFKIHTVQKGDSLWGISKRYSVSLDDLYRENGLNKNSVLKIGQQIKIPVDKSTATISTVRADTYQPSGFNMKSETYTVVRGDTLSRIAKRFNTSVSLIKAANSKTSDKILVGEKLAIPVGGSTSGYSNPPVSSAGRTSSKSPQAGTQTHIVKVGEYPATIARQYGITTSELLAINGITDPRTMQVGQELKVTAKGSSPKVSPAPRPVPSVTTVAPAAPKQATTSESPVKIRIVEADPLVESDLDEIDPDAMFESVEEISVEPVPLEE